MTLYIQPNQTLFPTTNVLTAEQIQHMSWLGFSSETTNEQIEAAGYIAITEPSGEQPDNTTLVVNKLQGNTFNTEWVSNTDLQQTRDYNASASFARTTRNKLLRDTDWTQGKDIPDNVSSAWVAYRQALRDIPLQQGFPSSVVWPQPPV